MKNKEERVGELLGNVLEGSVFTAYIVTLISAVLLLTVGTIKLMYFPQLFELLYFVGAGLSIGFHLLVKHIMRK